MSFKILALDGGGTWSLIEAKALGDLYGLDTPGRAILAAFDLVASNSGGSIIAAGLLEDLSPAQMLAIFRTRQDCLASPLPSWKKLLRLIGVGPRFSTAKKLEGLRQLFPKAARTRLCDVQKELKKPLSLLMMSYDFDRERARLLRSESDSPAANFPRTPETMTVVEAAHASSTPPIDFFDLPAEVGEPLRRYWDGAMAGYNNPALVGVIEALARDIPRSEIRVLSLGSGAPLLPLEGPAAYPWLLKERSATCLAATIKKAAQSIIADPPDAHSFIAHLALGGALPANEQSPVRASPVIRINPRLQPEMRNGRWDCPAGLTPAEFEKLIHMDMEVLDPDDIGLIEKFADLWLRDGVPNQPIRSGQSGCEIGYATYREAKQAWIAVDPASAAKL